MKMHADEVETDVSLVSRLIVTQFPQWSTLPVRPVRSAGTDHALYRLGEEMVVRLPRIGWAVGQVEKEQFWLPRLAPYLPLVVPTPLAMGEPNLGYPWRWSVYRWLEGENATVDRLEDVAQVARELAEFIVALHEIDTTGGPVAGEHNSYRGVALALRDAPTRAAIGAIEGLIDTRTVTRAWEEALQTPAWQRPLTWIHGDLQAGNLLCIEGRLSAVIDFGTLGVGDPACDLIVAWNWLPAHVRPLFREAVQVDEATWARGRGWALSIALIQLPYYQYTNPSLAANARYVIEQVLDEYRDGA